MSKKLIKSAERVRDLGEVFTPNFLVERMLDQFPADAWLPKKNWLEPTCGNGQFIIAVLHRKLTANLSAGLKPFMAMMRALDTTFGMDIMPDNVSECRIRVYKEVVIPHSDRHGFKPHQLLQVACVVMNNIRTTPDALAEDYSKFQHFGDLIDRDKCIKEMKALINDIDTCRDERVQAEICTLLSIPVPHVERMVAKRAYRRYEKREWWVAKTMLDTIHDAFCGPVRRK